MSQREWTELTFATKGKESDGAEGSSGTVCSPNDPLPIFLPILYLPPTRKSIVEVAVVVVGERERRRQ